MKDSLKIDCNVANPGSKKAFSRDGPKPTRNRNGDIVFKDFPDFRPNLTPEDIFHLGSFGGTYFRPIYSCVTGKQYGDEVWQEFPREWFPQDIDTFVRSESCDKSINQYNSTSGQSLRTWEEKGWIEPIDPYGWVQWYLRFYNGRRCYDDDRQIDRWNRVSGPKSGRWRKNLSNRVRDAAKIAGVQPGTLADEIQIRPTLRQLLQQWAFRIGPHHF